MEHGEDPRAACFPSEPWTPTLTPHASPPGRPPPGPPSHSLQQAGGHLVFLAALMMAAPTHLKGGARNTKKFKCCNQDSESNGAGIIEGNLQVK